MVDTPTDHKRPAECDYIRGLYVYHDTDADDFVAYHRIHPVSATGDSKRAAVDNCRHALDTYHDGATTHWDMWVMDCPECDDGGLEPLAAACDDPRDTRVKCRSCETSRRLVAVPLETGTRLCPDCDDDVRLQMTGMGSPLKCPECEGEYEIREIAYLETADD